LCTELLGAVLASCSALSAETALAAKDCFRRGVAADKRMMLVKDKAELFVFPATMRTVDRHKVLKVLDKAFPGEEGQVDRWSSYGHGAGEPLLAFPPRDVQVTVADIASALRKAVAAWAERLQLSAGAKVLLQSAARHG
jgi:hypothetical protein